jgi:hypothetical protein
MTHFELIEKNDYIKDIINTNLDKIKGYFDIVREMMIV